LISEAPEKNQKQLLPGLCPGPRWGAYSVPKTPMVGRGLTDRSAKTVSPLSGLAWESPLPVNAYTTLPTGCPRPSAGKKRWELCTTYRVTVYWLCEQNKTWPSALLHSTTCNDIKAVHDQLRIVRPHRSTTCIDAAYCYTAWSVCLSVCLSRSWALQKNA